MVARSTLWARTHPELHRERNRKWAAANRDKILAKERRNWPLARYARKLGVSRMEARRVLSELDARRLSPQERDGPSPATKVY